MVSKRLGERPEQLIDATAATTLSRLSSLRTPKFSLPVRS
jgi:hypothetical protein